MFDFKRFILISYQYAFFVTPSDQQLEATPGIQLFRLTPFVTLYPTKKLICKDLATGFVS